MFNYEDPNDVNSNEHHALKQNERGQICNVRSLLLPSNLSNRFLLQLFETNSLRLKAQFISRRCHKKLHGVLLSPQQLMHLSSLMKTRRKLTPVFSGVRVTRSLVLYVCFVDRCLSFYYFSFGQCVVCPSIYEF